MKGETLMDKAVRNLAVAKLLLEKLDDGDDGMLNMIGYHLQQAAELFLKHYLETESTGFPFTHDINILIDLVDESELSVKLDDSFRMIAGNLTEWEAKTRYVKEYLASRRAVLCAMEILQRIFDMNIANPIEAF